MALKSFRDWQKDNNRGSSNTSSASNIPDIPKTTNLQSYKDWAEGNNEFAATQYNSFSRRRSQQNAQRYQEQIQRRTSPQALATSRISRMVDNYVNGAMNAYRNGTYNTRAWNDQYANIKKHLDQYGSSMDADAVANMRSKLDTVFKQLNPTPLTPQQRYQQSINAQKNVMSGVTNPFMSDLADKTRNAASLTERWQVAKGAPLDNYSDIDLRTMRNMYNKQVEEDNKNNLLKTSAPDQLRAESYNNPQDYDIDHYLNTLRPYLRADQIGTFSRLGSRTEQMDYLAEKGYDDNAIDEIMDKVYAPQQVAETNHVFDESNARNAVANIEKEEGRRAFQKQYAEYTANEDFSKNSKYVPQFETNGRSPFPSYTDQQTRNTLTDNDLTRMFYESVNGNQKAYEFLHYREGEDGEKVGYSNILDERYGSGDEKYMTREEKEIFNYLYNTQGSEAAMKYYQDLSTNELSRRQAVDITKDYEEFAERDPFLANLTTTLTKPFVAAASYPMMILDWARTGHINAENAQYANISGGNAVRNKTAQMISDATGSPVWGDVFTGVMSAVDNAYGIALGSAIGSALGVTGQAANSMREAVTLSIMTTDAAQTATLENIRNGMGEVDAIVNGLAAGGIELLTEKIGMDNLFNSVWRGKGAWISWAKQMLSEGSEEVLSNVLNDAWGFMYDQLRGIDQSAWRREMNQYIIENGLSPNQEDEAFNYVFKQHLIDDAKAFGMGALSGGLLGGGALVNGLQNTISERSIADMYGVNNPEQLRRVAELGTDFFNGKGATTQSSNINDQAQNILDRLDNGQNVSNRQARNLAVQMTQATQEAVSNPLEARTRAQFVQNVADNYRNSGRNAMAATLESFYAPGTDGSRYVTEMEQVYNRTLAGKSIPNTQALTAQMVEAAVNAAEADGNALANQIQNQTQVQNQTNAAPQAVAETNGIDYENTYTPTEAQIDAAYEAVQDRGEKMYEANAQNFANAYVNNYTEGIDADAYTAGAEAIYSQVSEGRNLAQITMPEESEGSISEEVKQELFNAAVQDVQGGSTYVAETGRDVSLSGRSEWNDSQSPTVAGGGMAEGTGRTQSTGSYTTENVRPQSQNAYNLTGKTATAKSLGIDGGNDSKQVQIVELADTADNRALKKMASERGLKVVAFAGNNFSIDGMKYGARGAIKGDTIYVRVDAYRHSAYQIGRHEMMHDELRTNKNQKISRVFNHLRSVFGSSFVDHDLLPAYKELYKNTNKGDLQIMEEIVCDIYGEMNVFRNEDIPGIAEVYNSFLSKGAQIVQQTVEDVNETAEAVEEVNNNSPPMAVQFSMEENITDKEGNHYGAGIVLDTNLFDGVNPRNWGKVLGDFVYNNLAGTELVMYDLEGNPEKVYVANKNDRVKKDGAKNSHKVLDKLARYYGNNLKALITVHLDEALKASGKEERNGEHTHQWLDQNGWIYRTVIVQDRNGDVYTALLNIGNGRDRSVIYDINNIRRIEDGVVPSINSERGSHINNNSSSKDKVPQNQSSDNTEFSNDMTPEEAKGQISDAQFSIEFAPDIEERQTNYFNDHVSELIFDNDIFNDAVKKTNQMVQQMIKHKDILPTDKVGKVLVKNGSYDVSVENTTICVRTLAYNQFVDMVQDKLDRPLTQMESFLVSQKMYDIAVDPQCLYCYVSLDRKAYNEFLGRYVDDRNTAIDAYKKAGKPDVKKITKTSDLFVEFLHGRKATDNMLARYKSWLNAYNNGEHLLTKSDIKTELKRAEIMQKGSPVEIAQMKDILAYAQSASWSKKQMDYVAYNGEILKMGKRTVTNLNNHYGLRFYSFSDYSGAFIVENMQEVMDASLKGLKGLAYTKDVDFARIFADTGMNINISVFAKYNPQTEQYEIDPLQSANLEEAIALRNDKPNVGIVVATDTEGVKWAMHQDWSDVIIPFHTVRTGKDVADFYNWEIFTRSQNDTVNPDKQNLWDEYVKSTGKSAKKVSKMIYPSEHNNDYDTYMKLIDERGLTPRFNEFRFDENGKVDPTYMKLVNETRQSAQDTNPMTPNFNLDAAEKSFQKFVDKGGYFGGWYNDGVNVDAEAQTVADDIRAGKTAKDVDYGRQDIDTEALQKSRKTNREHARFSEDLDNDNYSEETEGQRSIGGQTLDDAAADLKERVRNLELDNKELAKKAEYFKDQTRLSALTKGSAAWKATKSVLSESEARKIGKQLISEFGSTIKADDIITDIQYWTTYLATNRGGKNTFEDVNVGILDVAKKLVENAQMVVESDGSEILKDIRNTTIKISPKVRNGITDYTEWRKEHFGRMKVSLNTGTDVTEFYNQMTEKWGESAFPSDILNPEDQLSYIAEFADNYKPITQNPYSYDMADAVQHAAFELYDAMLNAPVMKPTFADKANAKMDALKQESKQKIQDVKKAAREQQKEQIAQVKTQYRVAAENKRARKEGGELRKSILKRVKRLQNMKMSTANKALLNELVGDMNTDVATLTDKRVKKLTDLQAWCTQQEQDNPNFYMSDFVKNQLAQLNQTYLNNIINKKDPDALNKLRTLNDALLELEHMISHQNHLIDAQDRRDIRNIAASEIEKIRNSKGTKDGALRKLDSLVIQGTLSPMRWVHRMTGYDESSALYQLFKDVDDGGIKMLDFQHRASALFDEWMQDKKLTRSWAGKKAKTSKYNIVTADGQNVTIELTPMMKATLYLASKDGGWMRHMVGYDTPERHVPGGGISLPVMKNYRKGVNSYPDNPIKITKQGIDQIIADLTPQEKAFADAVNKFLNGMQREELNEVSNKLIGRDIAVVDDYLPISTDPDFLGKEYGVMAEDGSVAGAGNFKERVESNKPVRITDLTDILLRSIEVTSKYVGLAIPVNNINKLRKANLGFEDENGQYHPSNDSIDKAINKQWGETALDYMNKALADIQNPAKVKEDLEKAFGKIRSKYAQSVLVLNLSVGMKQAASYPTAAAIVGWKPLTKAMTDWKHTDLELIAKYTPLLWYRSRGFVNPDIASVKGKDDIWNNLPKALDLITGIDFATTKKLWKAAEYYVRDNNPGLYSKGAGIKGQTDAYYNKVAEIYNRIIEETQPNYTPWQRPQYLRSNSGVVQTLMMFKTQPMQNFNILYDAFGNFRAKRTVFRNNSTDAQARAAYKEASKNLRWAISSQIGQLITFASMTMLWNMFRRKKEKWEDENGNFSLEVLLKNMGKDIGSGIMGMLPFGSEVWEFLSSKIFGDTYYGFESVTDSAIGDLLNAFSSAWDMISNMLTEGEEFDFTAQKKKLKSIASAVSKIFGVPFDNIYNVITAGYKRGRDIFDNEYNADYYAIAWDDDPSKKKKDISEILYKAHRNGDMEDYEELRQILIDSGEWGTDKKTPEEEIDEKLQERFIENNSDPKPDGTKNTTKQGLYDYMFQKKGTEEYQKIHDDALEFGFTEEDITEGVRKSFAADLIGMDSSEFSNGDLYSYMLDVREQNKTDYNNIYTKLTSNGFEADEITDGLKKSFGQRVTGIVEDYKTADLYNYLYEQMTTDNKKYNNTFKEMLDIGFKADTVEEGVLKAYGQQLTGVSGDDFKADNMWDTLYNLSKSNKSKYNTEIATVKKLGYDDEKIAAKMKDAYGRSVTGLSGEEYSSEALFTKLYKSHKGNFSSTVKDMKSAGFSEDSIKQGLKNAYEAQLTGLPYSEAKAENMYEVLYNLYKTNTSKFNQEYQNAINVGYTEKAIKDGIHKLMKAEYGVDNVKKLPHQFAAPEHTLPSYWTYKKDEKDEGAPKDSGYATGSSLVGNYSYDNGELTLQINGRYYTYHGVPESVYEDFKSRSSKGSAYNSLIKGSYSYN